MFKKIVGLWFFTKWKNAKNIQQYIQTLIDQWAQEFFTGYVPSYWYEYFWFEVSPNGRFSEHEQITDMESLKEIVKEIHTHGKEIFVNLNAWYYTPVTFPFIERMVAECMDIGVDGFICGNIEILEYLHSLPYSGKINLSTILSIYNTQALEYFLQNYRIYRVILSRELTLKEIEHLVTSYPHVLFEVFWEWDFCRYNNGLCFAEHKYGERDICMLVVHDLIVKKRFRPDYMKIILSDEEVSQKLMKFDNHFANIFEEIEEYTLKLAFDDAMSSENECVKSLQEKLYKVGKREDLFFDALKWPEHKDNKNILTCYRALILLEKHGMLDSYLKELKQELHNSITTGMKAYGESLKMFHSRELLHARELQDFYAKWDTLNVFSYLFFSKFSNIDTVKFPQRGRNHFYKWKLIDDVLQKGYIDVSLLPRTISPERCHYDLTFLFQNNPYRFRTMLQGLSFHD